MPTLWELQTYMLMKSRYIALVLNRSRGGAIFVWQDRKVEVALDEEGVSESANKGNAN